MALIQDQMYPVAALVVAAAVAVVLVAVAVPFVFVVFHLRYSTNRA